MISVVHRSRGELERGRGTAGPGAAHHHARTDRAPDGNGRHQQEKKDQAERSTHRVSVTPAEGLFQTGAFPPEFHAPAWWSLLSK